MGKALENATNLYLEGIRDGDVSAIEKYSGARYTQHSTGVKDGVAGFTEFFNDFKKRNPDREVEIVRSFQDGRYVFMHVTQSLNGGEFKYVTADFFDSDDDGKIIEHWDVITEVVEKTASGHSQVDGPTEVSDLDKTEVNKALVRAFVEDVLVGGDGAKAATYISTESYTQHNPQVTDGLEGLGQFLGQLAAQGIVLKYSTVHLLVGQGYFVATLSEATLGSTPTAIVDIFRVADGKIVEHWDAMEEIGPKNEWVNSGKF